MSTLSYCAFENTTGDLQVCIAKLSEGNVADWSEYEIRAVKRLFEQAEGILLYKDEILEGIEELEEEDECEGCRTGDKRICDGTGCPNAYN